MSITMIMDENTKQLIPMYDGLAVSNEIYKVRDSFNVINTDLWDVAIANGDIVETGGNTAGSSYLKISKSTDIEDTETTLLSKFLVNNPFRIGLGMSLSQRIQHQRFSLEFVGVDVNGAIVSTINPASAINLAAISQTTTTLTITTQTPHGFVPGDRVALYGVSDSRANYGEVYVATVIDALNFTVTATPTATIPSVTIPSVPNSGSVVKVDPVNYADNALAVVWEGTSASNGKMVSRSSKGALYNSAETSFGSNNTQATIANAGAYADAFNPSYFYDVRFKEESVIARTMPLDSLSTTGGVLKRSQGIPDVLAGYKIRLKARNNKGMTKVVARVANASKSGSTTATITTTAPHGLTVGDQIMVYGIRDQVNFANLTVATVVASVIDATNFTIAFGVSATAASKGGVIIRINGSFTVAPANMSVQSISRTSNLMTLIGNVTWAGFSIGETIDLDGLVDTGNGTLYPQYEGAYKVANISTTSLVLYAPGADFASITCGGAVLKRTDLRLHFLRVFDYTRHTVEVDGGVGNYNDYQESLPVNVLNAISVTAGGAAAHGATTSGNPVRIGMNALTANPTAVTTGQTANLISTLIGALVQKPYSIPEADWAYAGAAIINTTDVPLKAALASNRNYLTGMQLQNTHATVATEVVIKDGVTVIWRGFLPANMQTLVDIDFATPLKATTNTALNFACITAGANVYINAQGYQAP